MDVVLGVAVTGPVARLALVAPGPGGGDVIDQSVVDLDSHPIEKLTETVAGTNRLLADEQHRLVATRVCWPDDRQADLLRQALEDSGVHNVAVLSQSQAVSALMRAAGRAGGVLVMDDETATLSVVNTGDADAPPTVLASQPLAGGDATGMLDTMMARLGGRPDAPGDVYLVGASSDLTAVADQLRDASTMRVDIAEDPTFALARGAALAAAPVASAGGDATALAPAVGADPGATALAPAPPAPGVAGDQTVFAPAAEPPAEEQLLAYSMAGEGELLAMDEFGGDEGFEDFEGPYEAGGEPAKLSRRSLLIGNAVIAFAVVGLASLAAAVVIAVRPTASQQPVVGHQNAAPGKFMPLLPTQQQAPVPPPPPDQPNAGFQGGTVPAPATGAPQQATPPVVNGTPAAPVGPETPGTPGFVPNPNAPIPIPIIVPFPGWRPPYPYQPPTTTYSPPTTTVSPPTTTVSPPTTTVSPPTTTVSPPTTTVSPPTTTVSPPTTTVSPPTTSYTPPTTSYTPPTTSYTPPTTTYSPPTTTYSPPTTTYSPPPTTQTQQTVPTQTQTQQTVPTQPQTQQTIPTQTHAQQPVAPEQPRGGAPGGGRRGFGF